MKDYLHHDGGAHGGRRRKEGFQRGIQIVISNPTYHEEEKEEKSGYEGGGEGCPILYRKCPPTHLNCCVVAKMCSIAVNPIVFETAGMEMINYIKLDIEEVKGDIKEVKGDIKEVTGEIDKVEGKIEECNKRTITISELKNNPEQEEYLKQVNIQNENRRAELNKRRAQLENRRAQLENRREQLENDLQTLKSELQALKAQRQYTTSLSGNRRFPTF